MGDPERRSLVDSEKSLTWVQEETKFNTLINESSTFRNKLEEIKKDNPQYFLSDETDFQGWKRYNSATEPKNIDLPSEPEHIFRVSLWKILIGVIILTIISILFVIWVLPEIKKMDNLLVGGMAAFVIISAITIYAIAKSDKPKSDKPKKDN